MSEFVAEAWVNDLGQTINPGDAVVAVGTSYKTTNTTVGVFEGVRYGDINTYEQEIDADGNPVFYEWHGRQYPKNKLVIKRAVVAVRVGKIPVRRWKYDRNTRKGEHVDGFKTSTLPLKRVFKIDTTAAELSKVSL